MNSKRLFSWSKRQSGSGYYRTGGIVAIDSPGFPDYNGAETKVPSKIEQQVPSELRIDTTENKQFLLSPLSATYMVNAASTLQAAFNDILRSPSPNSATYSRPASIASAHKPLPGRPRSSSLPSLADLPAELPGSILQTNQGFPPDVVPESFATSRPTFQNVRRSTCPSVQIFEAEGDVPSLLTQFSEPLLRAKSVPDLSLLCNEMRSVYSVNASALNAAPTPSPSKVRHKKSLGDTNSRRRSGVDHVASLMVADAPTLSRGGNNNSSVRTQAGTFKTSRPSHPILEGHEGDGEYRQLHRIELDHALTPTPTITRSRNIAELQDTVATQSQTISILQTQFANLRASHESYVESLTDNHSAEVASLKNNARALEERLARPSRRASSDNLLFLIDSTELQTPSHDSTHRPVEIGSASPSDSFQATAERQQRPFHRTRNSQEMENLKRKLSSTRRPETGSRNLLPELNQYKQNNVALQKQIESLMAKLNESKQSERALKSSLDEMTESRNEWQGKAEEASKLARSAQALQNTIDHLETRLEIANVEKLDAQEQLFNVQAQTSPFDFKLPSLDIPSVSHHDDNAVAQTSHMSMSTVFSSGSPITPGNESQELSTLATFVAHIERLQDQVRQKDAEILELQSAKEELQQKHDQIEQERQAQSLEMDIQHELLEKTQRTDTQIEQLRTAVVERDAMISEKDKSVRAVERQLEYHQLLLQAQIRRNATMTLHAPTSENPLPNLSELTTKADINAWVEKLQERLMQEKLSMTQQQPMNPNEARLAYLRQEIDFYVREIIYYKLDIRGYKSDIKKLKKVTKELSSFASRASDLDSDASSFKPAASPIATPELGTGDSPARYRPAYNAHPINGPIAPLLPGQGIVEQTSYAGNDVKTASEQAPLHFELQAPTTPHTPSRQIDSARQGKLTSPSRRRIKFGELLTSLPPSAPSTPIRHKRSVSESIIPPRAITGSSAQSQKPALGGLTRSASLSESSKGKTTPDRPPRPQRGLFESPKAGRIARFQSFDPHIDMSYETTRSVSAADTNTKASLSRSNSNKSGTHVTPPPAAIKMSGSTKESSSQTPTGLHRARAASDSPTAAGDPSQLEVPPERELSAAPNSSVPFVIGIGSPHNPAMITMQPTPCTITRYAPLEINPVTSRMGLGGTMASSTPVTSPTSPTDASPPERPASTKSRKISFSRKREDVSPKTPSHSRNASGSSIRTAIRIPKTKEREREEVQRVRKDSIGMPVPLGSPFGFERVVGCGEGGETDAYVVGEAI